MRGKAIPVRTTTTYNTLNARLLLQRWVPEALREAAPPVPVRPDATTEAGKCFRTVCAILGRETEPAGLPVPGGK